jgi:hypothetical protein
MEAGAQYEWPPDASCIYTARDPSPAQLGHRHDEYPYALQPHAVPSARKLLVHQFKTQLSDVDDYGVHLIRAEAISLAPTAVNPARLIAFAEARSPKELL